MQPFSVIFIVLGGALFTTGIIGIAYKAIVPGVFLIILGIFLALTQVSNVQRTNKMYDLSKNDYKKFVEEMRKEYPYIGDTRITHKDASDIIERKQYTSRIPPCPVCNSRNFVKRITTLDRSVSTAVFGIASSSIGKQWECTACRHKF